MARLWLIEVSFYGTFNYNGFIVMADTEATARQILLEDLRKLVESKKSRLSKEDDEIPVGSVVDEPISYWSGGFADDLITLIRDTTDPTSDIIIFEKRPIKTLEELVQEAKVKEMSRTIHLSALDG